MSKFSKLADRISYEYGSSALAKAYASGLEHKEYSSAAATPDVAVGDKESRDLQPAKGSAERPEREEKGGR